MLRLLLPAALLLPLGIRVDAQSVGSRFPAAEFELEGFTQTGAQSLEEYTGRALLLEFFAHW